MGNSKIEWTQATWNPVRGCSMAPGSQTGGCLNCYAARQAARGLPGMRFSDGTPLAVMRESGPRWTGRVELQEHMLDIPLRRTKPTTYFVNSMSDLFHEDLPDRAIDAIFGVMALCPEHTFQVLTKRAERMQKWATKDRNRAAIAECLGELYVRNPEISGICPLTKERALALEWPLPNVWLGVSCEDQATADARIPLLLQTPAALRFVSAEPLLGPVDLTAIHQAMDENVPTLAQLDGPMGLRYIRHGAPGLDWVIVGGESGPSARPMDLQWARNIVAQCKAAGVPVFVKQLGALPRQSPQGVEDYEDRPLLLAWHRHLGCCHYCRQECREKNVTAEDLCNIGQKRLKAALHEHAARTAHLPPEDGQR